MDIVGLSPLVVGSLVWQQEPGALWLTVVCKATYRLVPGESQLAPDQEILRAEDEHVGGDAAKSLLAPSDLVPRKARADVMLVGHAYAPRGEVVRALVARLCVGAIDKEIEIVGERTWTREGQLRELARFGRMPLVYERAAGGPGTPNPIGVRTGGAAQPDLSGAVLLPNLQPVGATPQSREQSVPPVGFGPMPAAFPDRRRRLGRLPSGRSEARMLDAPLPADFDFGYFNAAPPDQQVPALRDGERLILQNLHRDHPRLLTVLPAARPRAFAERSGSAAGEVDLRCDTLWIDTDRAICTLAWRGQISLGAPDETGRVVCAMEEPDACLLYEDVLALVGGPPARSSGTVMGDVPAWAPAPPAIAPPAVIMMPPRVDLAPEEQEGPHTMALPGVVAAGVTPFLATATARVAAFQPPGEVLPFAPGAGPSLAAKAQGAPPRRARAGTMAVIPGKQGGTGPSWLDASVPPVPAPTPAAPRFGEPPPLARVPSSSSSVTREAIELIWIDAGAAPRLRGTFEDLFADRAPSVSSDPAEREVERREAAVTRILASGRRCDAPGLLDAMAGAIDPDGRLRPPVVLVAGELRFPFDETEALRVREALVAGGRVPPGLLDAEVERLLLERRAYQRRALLGGKRIRALMTLPGAEAACPVYLPDALADVVPMFPAFDARLLAEAHAAQDRAEAHPVALRALALGRIVAVGAVGAQRATPRFPV